MIQRFKVAAIVAFVLLISCTQACRSAWTDGGLRDRFAPDVTKPMRVAILPFEDRAGGRSVFIYPFLPFIYLANFITLSVPEEAPDSAKGATALRVLLAARLSNTALHVVPFRAADTALAHLGLLQNTNALDPVELGRVLDVDAVVHGELTDFSTRYYILESRTVVEARVRMVSCSDRRELFSAVVGVADSAGISGGPTGYVSAAATPLAALGKGPFADLSVAWSLRAGDALAVGDAPAVEWAPGAPESGAPFIAAAAVGENTRFEYEPGDWIEVVAVGAPACVATLQIGSLYSGVPMTETSRVTRPGSGFVSTYHGYFAVEEGDEVSGAPITVNFTKNGTRATAIASSEPVTLRPRARAASTAPAGRPPHR